MGEQDKVVSDEELAQVFHQKAMDALGVSGEVALQMYRDGNTDNNRFWDDMRVLLHMFDRGE